MPNSSTRASARWTSRLLPVGLAGIAGFATFVFVARICDSYLLRERHRTNTVIALLVLYFVFLLLAIATYTHLLVVIKLDAGVVPLTPEAEQQRRENSRRWKDQTSFSTGGASRTIASIPYEPSSLSAAERRPRGMKEKGPGSLAPDIEQFYNKDVFVCESDGRPRWCTDCAGFKPDRAHHSSEIDRCVYKMDHYCPWVGGMVAENSFKFFVQFNIYATCLCAIVLGASASCLRQQVAEGGAGNMDPTFIATAAIGGFFGLFTFMMSFNTIRFVLLNLTQVDALNYKTKVYQLAVRVNHDVQGDGKFGVVRYPIDNQPTFANGAIPPPCFTNSTIPIPSSSGGATRPRPSGYYSAAEPAPLNESGNDWNSVRDRFATRTFAILRTEAGENPWDLGYIRNFTSVMGTNPLDWILPVRRSPCVNHERTDGLYEMGPVIAKLRRRYGVREATDETDQIELRKMRRWRQRRKRSVTATANTENDKAQGDSLGNSEGHSGECRGNEEGDQIKHNTAV